MISEYLDLSFSEAVRKKFSMCRVNRGCRHRSPSSEGWKENRRSEKESEKKKSKTADGITPLRWKSQLEPGKCCASSVSTSSIVFRRQGRLKKDPRTEGKQFRKRAASDIFLGFLNSSLTCGAMSSPTQREI